jgi:hypothetical protein
MAEKREKVIEMEQISCRKVSADGRFRKKNEETWSLRIKYLFPSRGIEGIL